MISSHSYSNIQSSKGYKNPMRFLPPKTHTTHSGKPSPFGEGFSCLQIRQTEKFLHLSSNCGKLFVPARGRKLENRKRGGRSRGSAAFFAVCPHLTVGTVENGNGYRPWKKVRSSAAEQAALPWTKAGLPPPRPWRAAFSSFVSWRRSPPGWLMAYL